MQVLTTAIPDVKVFVPKKWGDSRGFFSETYSKQTLAEVGVDLDFVQDNHSLSKEHGTVRGLHFQIPPFAQAKLIRVVRGAIFDVAVDLRRRSPTYGKHVSTILSAKEWNQIFIPVGFAHGLCTLEPDTEILYKVTNRYAVECDRGLLWNDPTLGIRWPIPEKNVLLSEKDAKLPTLAEIENFF